MTSAALLEEFLRHLRVERGLAENSWLTYRYQLAGYVRFLEGHERDVLSATRDDVVAYLEQKKNAGLKASSLFSAAITIRQFHRFMVTNGRAAAGPIDLKLPKVGEHLPHPLSAAEIESMLAVPTGSKFHRLRMYCALTLMWGTGMRVGELTGLRVSHVELVEGWIRVYGKGDRKRIVPAGPKARETLLHYMEARKDRPGSESDALFLTARGRPWTRGAFWWQMQQLAKEANVRGKVHPHRVRHAFGAILTARGVALRAIQENLGHRQIATTQIYTRIAPDQIRAALQNAHPRF